MAYVFADSLMASGGVCIPPRISKAIIGMTLKFLPDVGIDMEEQNQRRILT